MNRTIDYSPLFSSPTADEVAGYRRETLATRPSAQAEQIMRVVGWVIGGLLAVVFGITLVVPVVVAGFSIASGRTNPVELVSALPSIAIVAIGGVVVARGIAARRHDWRRRLQMARFAAANGLRFEPTSAAPSYPGAIFGLGSSRQVTDHFRTTTDRALDFGNYSYVTGSGKNRTTHRWGFLAVQLDRALPHMLLDSRANNGLLGSTNLPAVFARDQVLSLEGDFDRHFTLYCPAAYERDALYVFTPDLMALLIDEAAPFDVEIVDRWMLVYSARPFPLADPAIYQRLFRIVTTVAAKTLSQTDRYVDERIGAFSANIVAPQGQRLRRGFSWIGAVIVGAFVLLWFSGILSTIMR